MRGNQIGGEIAVGVDVGDGVTVGMCVGVEVGVSAVNWIVSFGRNVAAPISRELKSIPWVLLPSAMMIPRFAEGLFTHFCTTTVPRATVYSPDPSGPTTPNEVPAHAG